MPFTVVLSAVLGNFLSKISSKTLGENMILGMTSEFKKHEDFGVTFL